MGDALLATNFIHLNRPLSGTKETMEEIRRFQNQILEFASEKQFQMGKSTLGSLPKELK
jgi:hypothetical protein